MTKKKVLELYKISGFPTDGSNSFTQRKSHIFPRKLKVSFVFHHALLSLSKRNLSTSVSNFMLYHDICISCKIL